MHTSHTHLTHIHTHNSLVPLYPCSWFTAVCKDTGINSSKSPQDVHNKIKAKDNRTPENRKMILNMAL